MDRALLVLCALLLNAALAGPRRAYISSGAARLSQFPAHLAHEVERRLNRDHRSISERESRGMLMVAFAIFFAIVAGELLGSLTRHLPFIEIIILTVALPVRPSWDIASQIVKQLKNNNLAGARQALDGTVWKHHAVLDEPSVARAGIELLAVNYSEKIIGPAIWYMVFGLPGLFVSKMVYVLEEILVRPGGGPHYFSKATSAVHYVLHYPTSRLAAVLWLVASLFTPSGKVGETISQMTVGINKAPPQVMSLIASAVVLKLSLGGPSSAYASEGWVGTGSAKATAGDVKRALYLFALLNLMLFVMLGAFI